MTSQQQIFLAGGFRYFSVQGGESLASREGNWEGRAWGEGKGKGSSSVSSQAAGEERRMVYTPEESIALAKSWVSVVEDLVMSNNETGRVCGIVWQDTNY